MSGHRTPRSKQRQTNQAIVEYKQYNSPKYIVHAWDDLWSVHQRSWKKYRKTQWRNK